MQLHFYTDFKNINRLKSGIEIQVWNKSLADESDVHICFDPSEYEIRRKNKRVFKVNKLSF